MKSQNIMIMMFSAMFVSYLPTCTMGFALLVCFLLTVQDGLRPPPHFLTSNIIIGNTLDR